MSKKLLSRLAHDLEALKSEGLFKSEYEIGSPQKAHIQLTDGRELLNFCANNYLGLADSPELAAACRDGLAHYGLGTASVRFICGTQDLHHRLEARVSQFLGTESTILYGSAFDANGGLFETILGPDDAIISDELNHASIIDGIRLSKAQRYRYKNNDMHDLEARLQEAKGASCRLIATDGVFSMDGIIANLSAICDLADKYDALVMVDDCHATGFIGAHGRGTPELCGVEGRIDILTGTFGKALGGASGGFASGRKEIIAWLRQRSRPYLFSNSLAPPLAAAALKAFDLVDSGSKQREQLAANMALFRREMTAMGFQLAGANHPIIPVMLGDANLAQQFAKSMVAKGVYVISFCYPVVPKGKARIRTQISAAHTTDDILFALNAFRETGRELGVIA